MGLDFAADMLSDADLRQRERQSDKLLRNRTPMEWIQVSYMCERGWGWGLGWGWGWGRGRGWDAGGMGVLCELVVSGVDADEAGHAGWGVWPQSAHLVPAAGTCMQMQISQSPVTVCVSTCEDPVQS